MEHKIRYRVYGVVDEEDAVLPDAEDDFKKRYSENPLKED